MTLVNDISQLEEVYSFLAGKSPLVMDMEGICLGRSGQVTMLQLAADPGNVFCFDVLVLGETIFRWLGPLLQDPGIIKLCYDARCDADALFHIYGITLRGVYDIQVLYTILFQPANDPYLKGLYHTLQMQGVVEPECLQQILHCKRSHKLQMQAGSDFLLHRPLSHYSLQYCALDVVYLFVMYNKWRESGRDGLLMALSARRIESYVFLPALLNPRFMSLVDFLTK